MGERYEIKIGAMGDYLALIDHNIDAEDQEVARFDGTKRQLALKIAELLNEDSHR